MSTPHDPPYDPYDDTPTGPHHADRAAEHALLATLLHTPHTADQLTKLLNADDFNWPEHATIWDTWHHLNNGVPPDPVTLNDQLLRTRDARAVRALADITTTTPNPAHATHYAQIVRDHARLRTLEHAAAQLADLARRGHPDTIDRTLGDALQALEQAAMRYGPQDTSTATGLHDLAWILTGQPPVVPPPTICHRTDGHALFYAGKVNGIFGDPESGKTWLAQTAIVEALNAGGTAAMIDVDHNGPDHTAARLLLLGARLTHIADPDRFRYYEPEDADQLHAAVTDITTRAPTVTLIDSLGEIFPLLGVNTNDGDEITTAMRQVCTRPAVAGSCVITIDHLPKSADARSTGYAIGSIAKKRMIRGAYLRAEARVQPTPGGIGRITLRIEKDTAGELRKSSGGGYAGTLTLDSTHDHTTTWTIGHDEAPKNDDGTFRPTHVMERVSRFIEDNDQATFTEIKDAVTAKDKVLRDAINILAAEGFIARFDGPRRAKLHHSNSPYRETEDDHVS